MITLRYRRLSTHNTMTHPRILIAEDETASREGLRDLLAGWGYEVTVAADGQEALEKASELQPSLIIADLVMPKMDGITLLRTLKTDATLPSLIILTGHGTIETAVQMPPMTKEKRISEIGSPGVAKRSTAPPHNSPEAREPTVK